jgi:thiosulfate reductase/polysulfide reductase chain A
MVESKPVVCTGCAQQCGLLAHIEDGRVTRLIGDREHPSSRGFICQKGANAHLLHYDPARLHQPLKRVGPRGGGDWEPIEWNRALDEIADTIERLARKHGRESLAYGFGTLHAADVGLGERFMNLFGSPNTVGQDKVCYAPNALAESLTYGWGPTMYSHPVPGTTRCDVLWGFRPSGSMPLLWGAITAARKAGAKLIVVDPQRTHEAQLADLFLQNRPGSDTALALGLINVLIAEDLYDRDFVVNECVGFEDLAIRAAEYPPERVVELTWVPTDKIVAAARLLAANAPAIVHGSNGLCQTGTMAVQAGRALACLAAITGNVDALGGHGLAGPPRDILANGDAVLCDALPAEQRAKRLGAEAFPFVGAGYADVGEAMSQAWYGRRHSLSWCASAHEPTLWRAITTERPYPVKALILQCHNAVGSGANARAVEAALTSDSLELLVVHDLFLNKTSALADYALPAAHWLEKPFYSAAYGYQGFAGDYVEAKPAPVMAEHPSDYDLWRDLGQRLGQAEHWPEKAEEFWDSLLRPAGLRYDSVCAHLGPVVDEAARSADSPRETANRRYGTPSGKIELRSSLLERWGLDPLPGFELPPLFDVNEDAYPLVLTTGGRDLKGFHQNAQQMHWFRATCPDPLASLHPDTAADAGIFDGDWIRIATPIGEVRQRARLTDVLPRNVVHADRWWYPERANDPDDPFGFWSTNINACTDDATANCDPVMGSWLLRALPCQVGLAPAEIGNDRGEP